VDRVITMYARPRQTDRHTHTDRQTDGRTDDHYGNSATTRFTNASRAKN